MTDVSATRRRAWTLHAILCGGALAGAGVWWALLASNDRSGFHIGGAVGLFSFIAACLYAGTATGLVAAWGRRPRLVLLLHGVSLVLALALTAANCLRLPGH